MKINNIHFFNCLFSHESKIPSFIDSIEYKKDKALMYQSTKENGEKGEGGLYSLMLVPDYVNLNAQPNLISKKVIQENKGYAIDLKGSDDVEQYIQNAFGKKSKQIFNRIKRLEACYNISYSIYYREISKEKYDFLMDALKEMLVRRFDERRDENQLLGSWQKLHENLFALINSNKASFFVTYNGETPIQISLQYHFDKILSSAIPGYDIDYKKFGLGNLTKYKQIEWCLENNYRIFDQGYGDLEYKIRWSNYIYSFKHEIFFPKKSILSVFMGNLIFLKIRIKEYLKSKGVQTFVSEIKNKIFQKNNSENEHLNDYVFSILPNSSFDFDSSLEEMDFNANHNLKKIAIDFIYTNVEHIDSVKMFKVLNEKDTYLLKGNKKAQKFSLVEKAFN